MAALAALLLPAYGALAPRLRGEGLWYAACRVNRVPMANSIQVAIKTMKKTFESFNSCLELREVIFLRSLPNHPHLVPALDIFLDPISKKLHIAMEYMDGNLYQLMKARDHKYLDGASVKSILYQIISGLEHIHEHNFFHRDIKPENILVSTSAPQDSAMSFRRYSAMVTPPSTPPAYTIKIADFGLARETHSRLPYTTYVSTRWYRAPEVLLRAGEYSAPVDIWAIGAMAVEIATLKPLFPGGNEVDQVWRICEIMGSPGAWVNKHGAKVGGGEWKEGVKLAQKLGFSFPKVSRVEGKRRRGLIKVDGTPFSGHHSSATTVARRSKRICHLVLIMGSQSETHLNPSPGSRVLQRRRGSIEAKILLHVQIARSQEIECQCARLPQGCVRDPQPKHQDFQLVQEIVDPKRSKCASSASLRSSSAVRFAPPTNATFTIRNRTLKSDQHREQACYLGEWPSTKRCTDSNPPIDQAHFPFVERGDRPSHCSERYVRG